MSDIDIIRDESGEERRLGSLLVPDGFVSAFNTFEAEHPVWDDVDIRRAATDPDRRVARRVFGDRWVVNQKSHGSCNGYAGAIALSKARRLSGIKDDLLLSGAYLYSKINGGRDSGSILEEGMRAIQRYGVAPHDLVTWDMIYPNQQPRNADAEAAKHKGLTCWACQTKQGFRTAVAAGFTVIVAVHAGSNFQRLNSAGIAGVDNGQGNHAVHVDDIAYVNGTEVYDMQNSWGLGYGQSGRSYLTWDSFAQTFGKHVFYAVGSVQEAA